MTRLIWLILFFPVFLNAQQADKNVKSQPTHAIFGELAGKGFMSINYDLSLGKQHHISFGLTALDYEVLSRTYADSFDVYNWWSPGIMYYYLKGKDKHFLEIGGGMSISPYLSRVYDSQVNTDSPFSFHGVFGWRYQKKNGWILRAGFTPFYRPKVWFLPLIGISFGYSW